MNAPRTDDAMTMEAALSALGQLYDEVDETIARHAPVCRLSARCCRFREYGHDLFLSSLEREYWLRSGEPPVSVASWRPGENCPWQSETGLCHARAGRPLGCRIYYCDPAFEEVMPEITESAISRIKRITNQAEMAWDYRPAHEHLIASEAVWRCTSTVRDAGESTTLTTGGASFGGNRPSEEDS